MVKYERTTSFRFPDDIYKKLDILYEYYSSEAKRIGDKPKTKTEIIENAIQDLYYKMINRTQDADVVGRITQTVDDRVNAAMNHVERKIDQILYLTIKNDFGNKLLYRSPSIVPPPPNMDDAIEIIVDEESGWNNALEEYLMSAMKPVKDLGEDE